MTVIRAFANVLADDLGATHDFYAALLGFHVAFDSDWFVSLNSGRVDPVNDALICELGIWRRDHDLIPAEFRSAPAGVVLTFVVDDIEEIRARAQRAGLKIVAGPRDVFYGQRQLLVVDPNGALVDVSCPIAPSREFGASLVEDGATIRQEEGSRVAASMAIHLERARRGALSVADVLIIAFVESAVVKWGS